MLLTFIGGIIFATVCLSILQSISDIIITFSSVVCGKLSLKVAQNNAKIAKINDEFREFETQAIGFQVPSDEDYYEEYEDEEYEDRLSLRKIGF